MCNNSANQMIKIRIMHLLMIIFKIMKKIPYNELQFTVKYANFSSLTVIPLLVNYFQNQ